MFIDNLSDKMLRLCSQRDLSYESASELCCISPRYFGAIVRRSTNPTIATFEKICIGFNKTPDDLLLDSQPETVMLCDTKYVVNGRIFRSVSGAEIYPVCPNCGETLMREYQEYCDRCGQSLDWSLYGNGCIL